VTTEGNFQIFKIFEMLAEYDRERMTNEKFNEKEA
jgi:hypothetical protein